MMTSPLQATIERIVLAIRARILSHVSAPNVPELEFLELTANHAKLAATLRSLGHVQTSENIKRNARFVGIAWFRLAQEHLKDAAAALPTTRKRMTYSRSYYAAYNASKAVRYLVYGWVSLKGDDHRESSDLPDDFPEVDRWAEEIPKLREHRLLSDYDNWRATEDSMTLSPEEAVALAQSFVTSAQAYSRFTGFRRRQNIKEMIPDEGQFKAAELRRLPKVTGEFLVR